MKRDQEWAKEKNHSSVSKQKFHASTLCRNSLRCSSTNTRAPSILKVHHIGWHIERSSSGWAFSHLGPCLHAPPPPQLPNFQLSLQAQLKSQISHWAFSDQNHRMLNWEGTIEGTPPFTSPISQIRRSHIFLLCADTLQSALQRITCETPKIPRRSVLV